MKQCSKCKVEKDYSEFPKDRARKDGHYKYCRECHHTYYIKNKETIVSKGKEYWERIYSQRRPQILARAKLYREKRKDKLKAYAQANKERKRFLERENYKKNREKILKNASVRKSQDPVYKLKCNLRVALCGFFTKYVGTRKKIKTLDILGCDINVAKKHIERQFKKGMNWENHGHGSDKWHIDHKIPLATAKNEDDVIKLCHYTNLQPLWSFDNISKKDKILPIQMTLTI